MKQGVKINDADECKMCRMNEWDDASEMGVKQVRESPESKSRS